MAEESEVVTEEATDATESDPGTYSDLDQSIEDIQSWMEEGVGPGESDGQAPSEEKPKADAGDAVGEKAKADKSAWDKDRQFRDQAKAIERHRTENDEMRKELAELRAAVADKGREQPEEEPDPLAQLGDDADLEEAVPVLKSALAAVRKDGSELRKELADLRKRDDDRVAREKEQAEAEQDKADESNLKQTLTNLDKEFGEVYRGEAMKKAQATLRELGHDNEENAPPLSAVKLALKQAYRELRDADPKANKQKTRPAGSVPLDGGAGGREAGTVKHMSFKDALADMKRQGKIRG